MNAHARAHEKSTAIRYLGVASSLGSPFPGCELAPALLGAEIPRLLAATGLSCLTGEILTPADDGNPLANLLQTLASTVHHTLALGELPLILGGDHAIAAGTWKGVGRFLGTAPGLIWIDAHLDAHTPATSPSGNAHGMPLAAMLGAGAPAMTGVDGPNLDPRRLAVIGVRSYESAELAFLNECGVRIFSMQEIRQIGFAAAFAQARQLMGNLPWGISLDIDAFDPEIAPGVSTPVAGGLHADEVFAALQGILRDEQLIAMEISEFNPQRDRQHQTHDLIRHLLGALTAP
jgi:ornithine--oxo-acid transaminase